MSANGNSPYEGPFTVSDEQRRTAALHEAVETIKNVRGGFTTFQVVHTAALYERYLFTGETPPEPIPEPVVSQGTGEQTDADI
jgi:hypothetical protein